jgi:hypothetical protein
VIGGFVYRGQQIPNLGGARCLSLSLSVNSVAGYVKPFLDASDHGGNG